MVNFTILAGGYSSFIATYLFNSDANTLTLLGQNPSGQNPSWIALHPTNQSILYATNENTEGALQSFVIKSDGLLTDALSTTSTGGNGPAFAIPLSTGEVAAMNFGSGNGMFIPTGEDPTQLVSGAPVITFQAPSVSHPHMALEVGSEVFVPDLGADTIWRLAQSGAPGSGAYTVQGQIAQPAGSGPRHIVVRGDQLYTIHEDSSTLTQQTIPADPAADPAVPLTANVSIVPPDLPAGASMFAAEILLAEPSSSTNASSNAASNANANFTQPFLYVSNRNLGVLDPRGDAIAIFALEPQLTLVKHVFTGLDQIRGMQLSGAASADEFLVAAGVAGDAGTVVLRRMQGGADLEVVARNTEVPTRTSFVWLESQL